VWACSKDNEIDASGGTATAIGNQCSGPDDPACGTSGVCVLGWCRIGCLTDGECPQGGLCIGDVLPYGCSLEEELACSSDQPCEPGLRCGVDGKCRLPCTVDSDCPRNDHACVAATCVSHSESNADQTWFACYNPGGPTTVVMCDSTSIVSCNVAAAGVSSRPCSCRPIATGQHGIGLGTCVDANGPLEVCFGCEKQATSCALDPDCVKCAWEQCEGNSLYDAVTDCVRTDCAPGL
jgi:hypothetical protein